MAITNLALVSAIMKRVQYRDIERMFDQFIEGTSETVLDDLPRPDGNSESKFDNDEANEALDFIIEAVFNRFGYKWVGYCHEQILKSDFDFAMASPDQDGKCKRLRGHSGGHDVRDEMQGM